MGRWLPKRHKEQRDKKILMLWNSQPALTMAIIGERFGLTAGAVYIIIKNMEEKNGKKRQTRNSEE